MRVARAAAESRADLRRSVRSWMRRHLEEHRDPLTGELDATGLAEVWDASEADGGATLDPDHVAWEVAAELS